jgi:predicted transcriptional regulator
MAIRYQLGELQAVVLQVLWGRGQASISEVQQSLLPTRPLAYSTIATVLARLERQGIVRHRIEGRIAVYEAAVTEHEVGRSVVGRLVEELFAGSPAQLVSHLLEREDIDTTELARIKELIRRHEAGRRGTKKGDSHGR